MHTIRQQCAQHQNWKVAQSNPCFEVWLYFHAKSQLPDIDRIDQCSSWKPYLPKVIKGGFNHDYHPVSIETATRNSKASYQETGYFPDVGSTQLWQLAEELLPLIKIELEKLKNRFPAPEIIG